MPVQVEQIDRQTNARKTVGLVSLQWVVISAHQHQPLTPTSEDAASMVESARSQLANDASTLIMIAKCLTMAYSCEGCSNN